MATVTIEYDTQNKLAKEFVTFLKRSGLVKIQKSTVVKQTGNKPNKTTLKAMADKSKDSENIYNSVSDLMKDLKS